MGELSPLSQAIFDGHLVLKEVEVPFGPIKEETPRFHPRTDKRITDRILYAIVDVLLWAQKAEGYETSSDRLRLWYERQYMSSIIVAAKGDCPMDMPEFDCGTVKRWMRRLTPTSFPIPSKEQRVLLYDGPLSRLWAELDIKDGEVPNQQIVVFYSET